MAVYKPGKRGTIRGCPGYSIQEACVKLYEAMKGLGTDEAGVIDVITAHNFEERQLIKKKYQALYGKDLRKELDSELSFDFAKLVDSLMIDPEEYVLECIHKAITSKNKSGKLFKRFSSFFKEGLGPSEYMLIGMLCIKSNEDLKAIKKAYKQKYGEELENKIAVDGNNMPHDVCSFIIDMISGDREADDKEWDDLDLEQMLEDCDELANCKSEDVLHELLQERSFTYLKRLFVECLKNVTGKGIDKYVDELKGQISTEMMEAYRLMIKLIVEGEVAFYAERVADAIEGAGTDDDTLIKVVVHRSEIDLLDVMESYEEKYKKEMAADVGDDTSGDYKELLMKILKKPVYEFPGVGEVEEMEGEGGNIKLNEEIKKEEEEAVVVEKGQVTTVDSNSEKERENLVEVKVSSTEEQPEVKDIKREVVEEKEIEKVEVKEIEEVVCNEEKVKLEEDDKRMPSSEVVVVKEVKEEVEVVQKLEEVNSNEMAEEGKCEEVAVVVGEVEEKDEEKKEVDCEIVKENEEVVPEMEKAQEIVGDPLKVEEEIKRDEEKDVKLEQGEEEEVKNLEGCNDPVKSEEKVGDVTDKKEKNGVTVVKENGTEEGSALTQEF